MKKAVRKTARSKTSGQRKTAKRKTTKPRMSARQTKRAAPGSRGEGEYFRVILRPKEEFSQFRMQDVGRQGHLERVAGKRADGSWDTQAWLVSKKDAHLEDGRLVADSESVRDVFSRLEDNPRHVRGDIFVAERLSQEQ